MISRISSEIAPGVPVSLHYLDAIVMPQSMAEIPLCCERDASRVPFGALPINP
jgi:hypothetical protein